MQTNNNPLREQIATAIWSVHRDNPREAILDGVMQLFEAECRRREGEARKQAASDIMSLANQYACDDKTMIGSEEIRNYHYFNAINKIGEFDGR